MHRRKIILLFCLLAPLAISAADKTPKPKPADTLIVPGERIGAIALDADADKLPRLLKLGAPDFSDAGMGKIVESWYLGEKRGDKGRAFHRPDEIGLRAHFNDDASRHVVSQIEITSQKYATAEGIAPGSSLDAIRAKFPDIQPDNSADVTFWPLYGQMQFFKDVKRGIAFAVRKIDGTCVQIYVMPPGGQEAFVWFYPADTQDYVVDDVNGSVGPIQLGMSGVKLQALLGKPLETRDVPDGVLWRYHVPGQRHIEFSGLCIHLRTQPDGTRTVQQIRVTSLAFALTDKIYPGCTLNDARQATANIAKVDSYESEHTDIYADLRAGVMFDIRQHDSICTAISIFPPPLGAHPDMAARWLDLPPSTQPATGD